MLFKNLWYLPLLIIFLLTACASLSIGLKDPPLPNDIYIIPPRPDLPKEIAALSGKWLGTWSNGHKAILIVEVIHDTGAQVVYAWGDLAPIMDANYRRFRCKVISGSKPQIDWLDSYGALFNFELTDFDTIEGSRAFPGSITSIILKRAD